MSELPSTTNALLGFWPANSGDITTREPRIYDMRTSTDTYAPDGLEQVMTAIHDARFVENIAGLEQTGFELFTYSSQVRDWFDTEKVMNTYYEECKSLAREITGADTVFTYDHLIREPGKQTSGGGLDGSTRVTGTDQGGGYVGAVHMDYTTNTTWHEYLACHNQREPINAQRVISLNFWRPISALADDSPLAVCDARTVGADDLFETVVYGYGAENYSWHNIGIETYNVKTSTRQKWYYYPRMASNEVLVFKSFDSNGVIGSACPHASFTNILASSDSPPRRSIELRVLCFVGGKPDEQE